MHIIEIANPVDEPKIYFDIVYDNMFMEDTELANDDIYTVTINYSEAYGKPKTKLVMSDKSYIQKNVDNKIYKLRFKSTVNTIRKVVCSETQLCGKYLACNENEVSNG
jgi:uncharacterized surface anchored protein